MVTYLKALWLATDARDLLGGPWHETINVQRYKQLRRAWTQFRLEVEQSITSHEDDADNEALREVQQATCDITDGVQTATSVVQIARTLARYPVVGILKVPSRNKAPSLDKQSPMFIPHGQKKELCFAPVTTVVEDTPIPGELQHHRHTTQTSVRFRPCRSLEELERINKRYTPGAHAALVPKGWSDTSFKNDVLYNLKQLKVYVNLSSFHLEPAWTDALNIESEGLACEHRFWDEIQSVVNAGLESGALSKGKIAHSDCLLIGTYNGTYKDIVLYMTNDNKASGAHGVQAKRWTSELELLTPSSWQCPDTL